jgi:fumarate reductase subunit C
MGVRGETWLWIVQRASAVVLTVAVLVHLATMIYAVRHGLTAVAILERTHGNIGWLAFYMLFTAAIGVHAGIGVRTILREHTGWRGPGLDLAMAAFAAALVAIGWRAAFSVFL